MASTRDWNHPVRNDSDQNQAHPAPHMSRLASFRSDNKTFRPGKTVELENGDFVRIKSVWQDLQTTEVFLCGPLLRRTRKLGGLMACKLNETCWVQEDFLDGSGEPEDVPLGSVLRIRQLRMTNRPYEHYNINHATETPTPAALRESEGILFCRFKYCSVYESQAQKRKGGHSSFVEKSVSSLEPEDVDAEWLVKPEARIHHRDVPRQPNAVPRRTHRSESPDDDIRIISRDSTATLVSDNKQYTMADVFCGAGGVSSGAKQAGLKVVWGLERDADAARSFHQNFPDAVCEVASVEQFIHFPPEEFRVDIMHISPPCPSFSPMQTVKGKDFEEKQVVILSLSELVKMVRPRIITMEETFGLLFQRNIDFFATVVRSLNDFGYSVRWKILDLHHYGAPQHRRRLIIIAAGPNDPLPPFPPPTHLQTPNTIRSLISHLPAHNTHDPLHTPKSFPTRRDPYNANGPLREIIACSPTPGNYHPDGFRPFTVREFACLQTFPRDFRFTGTQTAMLRQIGNAVPPVAAKRIFEEVVRCLREVDGGGDGE